MCRKWKKTAALGLAVLIGGMMPMGTMLAAEDNAEVVQEIEAGAVSEAEVTASTDAPVINITLNGESCKVDGLGGRIDYKYTNVANSKFELSASLNGAPTTFSYFLDENPGDEAKDSISSSLWVGPNSSTEEVLSSNKSYVVYVKAGKNEQTVYARSCGVVVDTTAPEIVGLKEGETYPAGTTFKVQDANLDVVMVNEAVVTPESDGSYKVAANGTSCVIRAKDKAGNEKTCSITVSGGEEPGTGDEEPGTGDEKPGTGDETPGTGDEKPGTGDETPGTGDEESGTGDETPGTGDEEPGTGDEKPGTGDETPETGNIISETGVYALKAGVKYHLAEGKWQIDGDKSVYQGNSDFYVKKDGNYKFMK